jgi:hypothetical protein
MNEGETCDTLYDGNKKIPVLAAEGLEIDLKELFEE